MNMNFFSFVFWEDLSKFFYISYIFNIFPIIYIKYINLLLLLQLFCCGWPMNTKYEFYQILIMFYCLLLLRNKKIK